MAKKEKLPRVVSCDLVEGNPDKALMTWIDQGGAEHVGNVMASYLRQQINGLTGIDYGTGAAEETARIAAFVDLLKVQLAAFPPEVQKGEDHSFNPRSKPEVRLEVDPPE